MRDERRNGQERDNEIYFSFPCEIEHCKKHREKANNCSRVFNLRSADKKIKKLYKKDGYYARNTSDKRACNRRKRIIDCELDLRSRKLCYRNL